VRTGLNARPPGTRAAGLVKHQLAAPGLPLRIRAPRTAKRTPAQEDGGSAARPVVQGVGLDVKDQRFRALGQSSFHSNHSQVTAMRSG
jgi:hypothetical protein